MSVKRFATAGAALLALALATTGCAGGGEPQDNGGGDAPAVVNVGVVISLSGPGSSYGIPGEATLRLLADEYNASGASPQVKLTVLDDESQAAKAITSARSLLNDGADIILGGSISAVALPLSETLQAEKVPYIATAVDGRITSPSPGQVNDYVFQTPESQAFNVAAMLDYAEANDLDKVAMIYDATALGQGAADQLAAQAAQRGVQVVASEVIDPTAGTSVPQLVKVRDAGAQLLLVYAGHATAPVIQLDFVDLGWDVPIIQSSEALVPDFREEAGAAAVGALAPSVRYSVGELLPASDPQRKVILDWNAVADAKLGGANIAQIYYWDAWAILMAGLEGLEPLDTYESQEAMRAAFVKNVGAIDGLVGLVGIRTFTPQDHRGLDVESTMVLVRLTADGIELVD